MTIDDLINKNNIEKSFLSKLKEYVVDGVSYVANHSKEFLTTAALTAALTISLAGCTGKPKDPKPIDTKPYVYVENPSGNSNDIPVNYTLHDNENDLTNLLVEFSSDNGTTYTNATQGTGGDSVNNLATSQVGNDYIFVWDSFADNVALTGQDNDVKLRFTPSNGLAGDADVTNAFSVNNQVDTAPRIIVTTPIGNSNDISVDYNLSDNENDLTNLLVEFSSDNGTTYTPATQGIGGDPITNLSTSQVGNDYIFVWDSFADNVALTGQDNDVKLRFTPSNGLAGDADVTNAFSVNNNGLPEAEVNVPINLYPLSRNIDVELKLKDRESDLVDIICEFSLDNGVTYATATQGIGGDPITNLSTSQVGEDYIFVWDSFADNATLTNLFDNCVMIRITPSDSRQGIIGESNKFSVNNMVNVDSSHSGVYEGTPENPFQIIQEGIDNSVNGQAVFVLPGTYLENLIINSGHDLSALKSRDGCDLTIIDGNQNGSCISLDASDDVLIKGFKLTNGGKDMDVNYGGGIYSFDSSPIIESCLIVDNYVRHGSQTAGGGICFSDSTLSKIGTVKYCTISNNTIESITKNSMGAGVYSNQELIFKNNIVYGNNAIAAINEWHGVFFGTPTAGQSELSKNDIDFYDIFATPGTDDISLDPEFIDPASGNYKLGSTSPCKDINGDDEMGCYVNK